MKRTLRLVASLGFSLLLLWLAFRNVDFGTVARLLRDVSLPFVGVYVLLLVFIQVARAARWDVLVSPFARLSRAAAFRMSNLGTMLILVLPLRLGELARPYLLKKEAGAPLSAGLGAVAVERAVDGLLVTLLFFVSTTVTGDDRRVSAALRLGAIFALAFFVATTLIIIAALLWRDAALRVVRRLVTPASKALAERLAGMLGAFVEGLRSLPDARAASRVLGWTAAYWVANGLGFYLVMRAFGWALPVTAGFTLVSIMVIAIMIPAGPGFLGTYQGGIAAGLSIYGVGASEAAAYGLVVYPLSVLVVVGFGLPYLFTPRTSLGEIVRANAEPR